MSTRYQRLDSVRHSILFPTSISYTVHETPLTRIGTQDEERLPDGLTRIAYDADEQRYTYQDADGSLWEGEEGERYGRLHQGTFVSSLLPPCPP
jgi:hypothetical protein